MKGAILRLAVRSSLEGCTLITRAIEVACAMGVETQGLTADETFVHELVTAGHEAFTNIVVHGYRRVPGHPIAIEAAILGGDTVRVALYDWGATLDLVGRLRCPLDELPERGMGLYMIRSLVDVVSYRAGEGDRPNRLTLEKHQA